MLRIVGSLVKYRRFIWKQAVIDLRHRYAGTGMGVAWNVIHPLGIIAIYSIVFSSIMRISLPNQHGKLAYTLYLCSGFFPWLAFSDCIMRGCNTFVANANYLKRLAIPEVVFVARSAASTALSLVINFSLLVVISLILGASPRWTWALLPLPLGSLLLLGFSLGFLLGILNVFFRDIAEWATIVLQIAMWTVPIVYLPELLPARVRALLPWHPVAPAIAAVREMFFSGTIPQPRWWWGMIGWPVAIFAVAALAFGKLAPEMRDAV